MRPKRYIKNNIFFYFGAHKQDQAWTSQTETLIKLKGKTIENALLIDENFIYEDNFIFILKDAFPIKRKIKIRGAIGNKLIITGNIIDDEKLITTRLTNFSKSKKLYSKNKNAN